MELYQIYSNGESHLKKMTKKEVSKLFDMHTRDLRPVFLSHQLFTISVRGNGIIVNLGGLKMIIGKTDVCLFSRGNEKTIRKFVEVLSQKLQKKIALPEIEPEKPEKNISNILKKREEEGEYNEDHEEHEDYEDKSIPFEFLILESGFVFVLQKISGHLENFEKQLEKLLEEISLHPSQLSFEKLLQKKKEISRIEKSAQEIQNALDEVLEDEEEVESLWISRSSDSEFEEDDVESILENLLEQVTEISHKIAERKENIDDTQEIVTLKMANIRNTIIQYDLIISAVTGILGVGTLVSGFYGMNVLNPNAEGENAFFLIIGMVLIFSSFLLLLFLYILKKKDILRQGDK
jgi:coenzyme F420-reducing hydrogenase delta subunit